MMPVRRPSRVALAPLALLLLALTLPATAPRAQVTDVRSSATARQDSTARLDPSLDRGALATAARAAQREFEAFRRANLPGAEFRRAPSGACDEQVGRFCYWYDEHEGPPPREPERIRAARERLLALLDSAARANPADRWFTGQRVRYLTEADRAREALAAARGCVALNGWWCPALAGFAEHMLGDFVAAERSFADALALMSPREQCAFRDLSLLLDDALLQRYRALACEQRAAFESRLLFLARPFWSVPGNDARTEYFARVVYTKLLEDAASAHEQGFDRDEAELLLRYSWPRAWARVGGGLLGGPPTIVSFEPSPALPFIPNALVADNPAASDSTHWTRGVQPVRGRYTPAYAMPLHRLPHQAALFRRGDSALVVLAYDVRGDTAFAGGDARAALVVTTGDSAHTTLARLDAPYGVLTARQRWGPVLMSAEVLSAAHRAGARARYGVRPPYSIGARVSLSDILLFEPYGEIPQSLDEALPHARPSLRVRADRPLGFYWESYGTDPAGESLDVSLVVVREDAPEPKGLQRLGRALRLWNEAAPVSVSLRDRSARGSSTSPRAMTVDISTLRKGRYTVQLEIEVAGQYVVRAERTIEVIE